LVYGFADEQNKIELSLMISVIKDKLQGGIFPAITKENKEQVKIRQLILEEKGVFF
jgi:hypothetical protein